MSDNTDWAREIPPYGRPSRRMLELNEYEERLKAIVTLNGVLGAALARRAQNPPTWFMPDGTIKFLPKPCEINLAATPSPVDITAASQFPPAFSHLHLEPFEGEVPLWQPLPMFTRLVGRVRADFTADQYRNPGRLIEHLGQPQEPFLLVVDPPAPTAGRDVFLHPTAIAPFYDLITEQEIIIDIQDVEMNEDADTERKRLEIIATLLEEWDTAFSLQFSNFALQTRNWRMGRREWEWETVQAIFVSGNLHMLDPDFDISILVNARHFVNRQNDLDRYGGIPVWEGMWDKEGCDALISCQTQVRLTLLRVQRILFDLIPLAELRLEQNHMLVADMQRLSWLIDDI